MKDFPNTDTVEGRIAFVMREVEEFDARQAARQLSPRRVRRQTGASVVFSVRLDRAELAALEDRAAAVGIKPSVLARNLVRLGLAGTREAEVSDAVDRLDSAVQELRSALSARRPDPPPW